MHIFVHVLSGIFLAMHERGGGRGLLDKQKNLQGQDLNFTWAVQSNLFNLLLMGKGKGYPRWNIRENTHN